MISSRHIQHTSCFPRDTFTHHDDGARGEVGWGTEVGRPDRNPDELARLLPGQEVRAQALPGRLLARVCHLTTRAVKKEAIDGRDEGGYQSHLETAALVSSEECCRTQLTRSPQYVHIITVGYS